MGTVDHDGKESAVRPSNASIRAAEMLSQLEHLTLCGLGWRAFWGGFIRRLITALDGAACAVWIIENGEPTLQYQANLPELLHMSRRALRRSHTRALLDVARDPCVQVDPPSIMSQLSAPGRMFHVCLAPVVVHGQTRYVVEFVTANLPSESASYLSAASSIAGRYVAENDEKRVREAACVPRSWAHRTLRGLAFLALCAFVAGALLQDGLFAALRLICYMLVLYGVFSFPKVRDQDQV